MAHVTGGGLTDNLPRALPDGCRAEVRLGSWRIPHLFELIRRHGEVSEEEMRRVFNLGIGLVLIVDREAADAVAAGLAQRGHSPIAIGEVVAGERGVVYRHGD
jgi:phosphoribosylformylglycinamidine cyclo-ligase